MAYNTDTALTLTNPQTAPYRDKAGQVYNVLAYGLVADTQVVHDATCTNGSAVINSASANWQSTDVGKTIAVGGGGASGLTLVTTILSVQSTTQITLATNALFTVSTTTATVTWGTDNTAAMRTLITTVSNAGGGCMFFPQGVYGFYSGTQTAPYNGGNGVLNLPSNTATTSSKALALEFVGAVSAPEPIALTINGPPPMTGSVLIYQGSAGQDGGSSANGSFFMGGTANGSINNVVPVFRNLTIRLPNQPNFHGIDARACAAFQAHNVTVDVNRLPNNINVCPAPVYGIAPPLNLNNFGKALLRNSGAAGFFTGILLSELTNTNDCWAARCSNAFDIADGDHCIFFGKISSYWCKNCVRGTQPNVTGPVGTGGAVVIGGVLDIEDAASGTWAPVTHISDASNLLRGGFTYARVVSTVGKVFTPLTVTGAANLSLRDATGNHVNVSSPLVTAAAGANAGTTPPTPVVGQSNDTAGTITFGTGTTPAAGAQVGVTFATAYGATPLSVQITPLNAATQALGLYLSALSTTGFTLSCASAPAASQANTVYKFAYSIVGQQ